MENNLCELLYSGFNKKIYFNIEGEIDIIDVLDTFDKIINLLDFFIFKCIIYDYKSDKVEYTSRDLIIKIVKNIEYYIYQVIEIKNFCNFSSIISRYRYLIKNIRNRNLNYLLNKNFIELLISTIDIIEDIIFIFNECNIHYNNIINITKVIKTNQFMEMVPFSGGKMNNKIIKSYWISNNFITNLYLMKFINSQGYYNKNFWSLDGYNWIKTEEIRKPIHWKIINNIWFVNDIPFEEIKNKPITTISFYEAEAITTFLNGQLPTVDQWLWTATNRNKVNFNPKTCIPNTKVFIDNRLSTSLMNINNIYGYLWEYTQNHIVENNKIKIILKGGDYKIPICYLNNKLTLITSLKNRFLSSGFRLVKYIN